MNNISIVGRLCAEPERKTTNSGKSVTAISVAVKRPFTKDSTDFLTVVLWEKKCDYICQYGRKGDMVAINGMLTVRKYEDKNGNKRESYEIVANSVELVGGKKQEQNQQEANITQLPQYPASAQYQQAFSQNQQGFETVYGEEDLPF